MFVNTFSTPALYFQARKTAKKVAEPRKHIARKVTPPSDVDVFVHNIFKPQHGETYKDSEIGKLGEDADNLFEGRKRTLVVPALQASIAEKDDAQTRRDNWYEDALQTFQTEDSAVEIIKHYPTEVLIVLEEKLSQLIGEEGRNEADDETGTGFVGEYMAQEKSIRALEKERAESRKKAYSENAHIFYDIDDLRIIGEISDKQIDELFATHYETLMETIGPKNTGIEEGHTNAIAEEQKILNKIGNKLSNATHARTAIREKLLLDNDALIVDVLSADKMIPRPGNDKFKIVEDGTRSHSLLKVGKIRDLTKAIIDYIVTARNAIESEAELKDELCLNYYQTDLHEKLMILYQNQNDTAYERAAIKLDQQYKNNIINYYFANEALFNDALQRLSGQLDPGQLSHELITIAKYSQNDRLHHTDPNIINAVGLVIDEAYPKLNRKSREELIEIRLDHSTQMLDLLLKCHGFKRETA